MKYRVYIPVILISLMFFALIFFRKDIATYISQNKIEKLSIVVKDTVANYITKNYNYSQNGENYEYTFLEFGSTGCYACRQMEKVMEEIESSYKNKVKVVFINVMKKETKELSDYYGIATIPTQVLLDKKGREFFRHTGFFPTEDLEKKFSFNNTSME